MKGWSSLSMKKKIAAVRSLDDWNLNREAFSSHGEFRHAMKEYGVKFDRRANKIHVLHKSQYASYLRSSEWSHKRLSVLARDNHTCQVCGGKEKLHVHHLTYARKYNEPLYDLVTLCEVCHKIAHMID